MVLSHEPQGNEGYREVAEKKARAAADGQSCRYLFWVSWPQTPSPAPPPPPRLSLLVPSLEAIGPGARIRRKDAALGGDCSVSQGRGEAGAETEGGEREGL